MFGQGRYFFWKERRNWEEKGGKYLENEDIFLAEEKKNGEGKYISFGGKEKQKRKKRKIFGEGQNKSGEGKEKNIQ